MLARVTLVPGDSVFAAALATALRAEGHEVLTVIDPFFVIAAPRPTDTLEVVITQSTGSHSGIRIRVTGLPRDKPYAGVLGQFLAEPVEAADVIRALRLFVG